MNTIRSMRYSALVGSIRITGSFASPGAWWLADGKVFLEGIDFGELNSDGKLHRIVGFFGPLAQAIG
jgi:hypothetical protein